ncbi:MAG: T9SS type A sorting domain-containing protein [candidate division Zixibacteria bacterium]|nr:T9SS type A sorting domain-containing protein [candidate division Zixibacteria bacterium]
MKRCNLLVWSVTGIVSVLALLTLAVPLNGAGKSVDRGPAVADMDTYIDANALLMFVENTGLYGRDRANVFNYDYGTFYPYTGTANIINGTNTSSPLYSAGLWLGGRVGGEVRVTVADYSSEYTPGPMTGGTFDPTSMTNPTYRVYHLYADSLAGSPNQDYLDWPTAQGAPVDGLGSPLLIGEQMLWSVFNDADTALHTNHPGSTDPLGVEIQQWVWAEDVSDMSYQRVIHILYKLYNKGTNVIDSMYLGLWFDPDLGNAQDDRSGCDPASSQFFCYNGDNDDQQYGTQPPAIGCRILAGPVVASTGDTARFGLQTLPEYRNMEMTAFIAEPTGGDPDTAVKSYNLMHGLPQDGIAPPGWDPFMYDGDPVTGTGELVSFDTDLYMMGSCGPFQFTPGDSQQILIRLAVGHSGDRLTSITALRNTLALPIELPTEAPSDDPVLLPSAVILSQNYPNPFNPTTTIAYDLVRRSTVNLTIYNVLGQEVAVLDDGVRGPGHHVVEWNGKDRHGNTAASGVYFYRLTAGDETVTRKMLLLR